MKRNTVNDHHTHSRLVRSWHPERRTGINPICNGWKESEEYFSLRSPHNGYTVAVYFNCYQDHPEYVHIRSTNWRCEYEPNAVIFKDEARKFYKQLLQAGFVKKVAAK